MWQVIYNISNGGTDRTPVPVWPNVRQKKTVFANSGLMIILIHYGSTIQAKLVAFIEVMVNVQVLVFLSVFKSHV